MKNNPYAFMSILVLCLLALMPIRSEAYLDMVLGKGSVGAGKDVVLRIGAMPTPFPSRRQVIDADKGKVCLQCHRIPYPTAPQGPQKPGGEIISSIKVTPPGGLRLLTPLSIPTDQIGGGWSPDGKRIAYSINLFDDDWDIWVMDADGKNRAPLISSSAIEIAKKQPLFQIVPEPLHAIPDGLVI